MSIKKILGHKGQDVKTCTGKCKVTECIAAMNQNKIGALVVMDESKEIAGIVTERDVLKAVDNNTGSVENMVVPDIMTGKNSLIVIDVNEPVEKAMELMTNKKIRHIPVTENGNLTGIISIGDIVKFQLEKALVENESLKNYITGV